MSTRRRFVRPARTVALVVVAGLLAVACAEGTRDELEAWLDDSDANDRPPPTEGGPTDPPTPPAADERIPSVTPGGQVWATAVECPFDTSTVAEVTCGEVGVPSRGEARREVRLAYARFFSTAPPDERQPDPVVYLHGGPGGEIVDFAGAVAPVVVDPFVGRRDVIVYDQRGGGRSSPLPPCRRAWDLEDEFYSTAVPHRQIGPDYVEVISACGTALGLNTDFDLDTYTSAVHADDLVDLMAVLGVETFNLYGSSYGSRLAQTVLRDHPDGIRTVIMSGVYPIEEQLIGSTPAAFRDGLDTVFAACAADPRCADALPDPWATLADQVARLDAEPARIEVPIHATESFEHLVAGDDLINALHAALYRWDVAAMIPDLLIDLTDGDTSRLERLAADSLADISDVAAYLAVQCPEEAAFTTVAAIDAAHTGIDVVDRIDLPPGLLGSELVEICAAWDLAPVDERENDPVTWDQPTLLFSGGLDPITPPAWARTMAARLPDARLVHSVDLGHDSDESPCAQTIMAEFVDDPQAPVSDCAGEAEAATIDVNAVRWRSETVPSLTPATLDLDDEGVLHIERPDWLVNRDGDTRIWWRDLDALDSTAVVIEPGPFDLASLSSFLDVELEPAISLTPTGTSAAGWDRAELAVPGMDLVVHHRAEAPELTVALVAADAEIDDLEREVVAPVLASIDDG